MKLNFLALLSLLFIWTSLPVHAYDDELDGLLDDLIEDTSSEEKAPPKAKPEPVEVEPDIEEDVVTEKEDAKETVVEEVEVIEEVIEEGASDEEVQALRDELRALQEKINARLESKTTIKRTIKKKKRTQEDDSEEIPEPAQVEVEEDVEETPVRKGWFSRSDTKKPSKTKKEGKGWFSNGLFAKKKKKEPAPRKSNEKREKKAILGGLFSKKKDKKPPVVAKKVVPVAKPKKKESGFFGSMFKRSDTKKPAKKPVIKKAPVVTKKKRESSEPGFFGSMFKRSDTKKKAKKPQRVVKKTQPKAKKEKKSGFFSSLIAKKDKKKTDKKVSPAPKTETKAKPNKGSWYASKASKKEEKQRRGLFSSIFSKSKKTKKKQPAPKVVAKKEKKKSVFGNFLSLKRKERSNKVQKKRPSWYGRVFRKKQKEGELYASSSKKLEAAEKRAKAGNQDPMHAVNGFHFNDAAEEDLGPDNIARPYDETKTVAVIERLDGVKHGPFRRPGNCIVYHAEGEGQSVTGLSIPIQYDDLIVSKDSPVRIMHSDPALITIDEMSRASFAKMLKINTMNLYSGRARLKVLSGSQPWVIKLDHARVFAKPGTDVIFDISNSIVSYVSVVSGGVEIAADLDSKTVQYSAGQLIKIDPNQALEAKDIEDEHQSLLTDVLPISKTHNYQVFSNIAASNVSNGDLNWPVKGKVYSQGVCTRCSFAFGTEKPVSHCPVCKSGSSSHNYDN